MARRQISRIDPWFSPWYHVQTSRYAISPDNTYAKLNRHPELKELIAMHSSAGELGGDLKSDTVTIIGATLDLQEKVSHHLHLWQLCH